ncbi:hypothetical protein Tco_0717900 [Tanacetum coccineum]
MRMMLFFIGRVECGRIFTLFSLKCFLCLALKINLNKSKINGINVENAGHPSGAKLDVSFYKLSFLLFLGLELGVIVATHDVSGKIHRNGLYWQIMNWLSILSEVDLYKKRGVFEQSIRSLVEWFRSVTMSPSVTDGIGNLETAPRLYFGGPLLYINLLVSWRWNDIKKITLDEYVEYKAEKERRFWKSIRSKGSPKRDEVLVYSDSDEEDKEYYRLSHVLPYFQTPQPCTKFNFITHSSSEKVDIDNMTIEEYESTPLDKKDSGLDEILDDLFRIRAENLKRIEQEKVQNGCDDDISRDTNHESVKVVREEESDNDIDSISIQVPDVMDDVLQPLILQTIHTTQPDKDYVAPATKTILDELLEEFKDEILNITVVDEEAGFNPTRDIVELERLIATNHQSYFIEIKVLSCIVKTNVEHETFI